MINTIKAWEEAIIDLGVEIQSPFILEGIEYPLFVKHFGSKKGTIVFDMDDFDKFDGHIPKEYYYSGINPSAYNKYDRNNFIETLKDWGWFGPKNKYPSWYDENNMQK